MGLAETYAHDVHENLKLYANWPFGEPAELGDYGILNNDLFKRLGTLSDLGISFGVRHDGSSDQVEYRSKDSVELKFTARGKTKAGVVANAKVTVAFKRTDAVLLNLAGCRFESIGSLALLTPVLTDLRKQGKWSNDYVFVSRIARVESSTIAMSTGSTGGLTLEAAADVPQINLADAKLRLGVVNESNVGIKAISRAGLTPLLGLARHTENPYSGKTGTELRNDPPAIIELDVEAWKALGG